MTTATAHEGRPLAPAVLEPEVWQGLARDHALRADALTEDHRERRAAGASHPVEDFLYDYYGTRPAQLRRWHPGLGRALAPTAHGPAEHGGWRWYSADAQGVVSVDAGAFLRDRGAVVGHVHRLLTATAGRPAATGCFGLHEWAMVYRQPQDARRHGLPLRLGAQATDAVVEAHQLRCTHIDAFRFFTPDALGRNRDQLTRESQPEMEQPGCLHATMDLWKWAAKLGPLVPGDLALDCFALAREVRWLDMRASPYDVSGLGGSPVPVETPEGKAEYVRHQRSFAERAAPLRGHLIEVCRLALAADGQGAAR